MSRVSFVFLIVVFILFSCEKKITDEQFEQNVFSEIILKVVDSTYQDYRILTIVPEMGERIYDKNGKWIGRSLIGQRERDLKRKAKAEVFIKDSLNLIIAIGTGGLINDKTELQNYNSPKFKFKHLSELPADENYKNWAAKYPKFAGALVFSNINFDVSKINGTLNVSYYCGTRCGLGYVVTIKKINNKWVISKVENSWIA
ncbi:hypothetical protein IWX76_000358 [Pedobacter sp. CAN_A7]|uniref:hypothetical protein n=1 Tax=Pedobacter sp. CAN_A7 TaxID=2787722 RepID=UPI0018C9B531